MADAREIERLFELKNQGALTDAEYERQKVAFLDKKRRKGTWWKGALVGLIIFAVIQIVRFAGADGLPNCDSDNALSTLKVSFDESQAARIASLSAVEITKATQTAYDGAAKRRQCTASVAMNNGESIMVTFAMQAREDGKYLLTFAEQ